MVFKAVRWSCCEYVFPFERRIKLLEIKGSKLKACVTNCVLNWLCFLRATRSDWPLWKWDNTPTIMPTEEEMTETLQTSVKDAQTQTGTDIPTNRRKYACQKCIKCFKFETSLWYHNKINHPDASAPVELWYCTLCQTKYRSKKTLDAHNKYDHPKMSDTMNGIITHNCELCNTKHKRRHNYLLHLRTIKHKKRILV